MNFMVFLLKVEVTFMDNLKNDLVTFDINVNGEIHKAIAICNYVRDEKEYCIYAIRDKQGSYDVYYGRLINDVLVPDNIEDADINYKIVSSIIKTVK